MNKLKEKIDNILNNELSEGLEPNDKLNESLLIITLNTTARKFGFTMINFNVMPFDPTKGESPDVVAEFSNEKNECKITKKFLWGNRDYPATIDMQLKIKNYDKNNMKALSELDSIIYKFMTELDKIKLKNFRIK